MPLSFRLRLALFGTGVVGVALVVFGSLLYLLMARAVVSDQDTALRARAKAAVGELQAHPPGAGRAIGVAPPVDVARSPDVFIEVLAADGSLVDSTGKLGGSPPPVPSGLLARAESRGGAYATVGTEPVTRVRLYAEPWSAAEPGNRGYVVAGQPTRVNDSNLHGLIALLVISGVPTLLAALGASWLVAGRALRPLKRVAGTADDIGRTGDFGRRLPPYRRRDEIGLVTVSFNRMLDQLQGVLRQLWSALEAQRRFIADASHELRTPLTTIRGNAGLLVHGPALAEDVRRESATDIAEEADRMARLVDQLLTLASADAGLRLEVRPCELRPLVDEVCRQAAGAHPELTWASDTSDACVLGEVDALRRLTWILLDNAAKFSGAGGRVEVTLRAAAGWARLCVVDDGPGIPAAERERIFERFYRGDPVRSGNGAGLGLAIARWIVEQHGGRILAAGGRLRGAALYVDLPLSY